MFSGLPKEKSWGSKNRFIAIGDFLGLLWRDNYGMLWKESLENAVQNNHHFHSVFLDRPPNRLKQHSQCTCVFVLFF